MVKGMAGNIRKFYAYITFQGLLFFLPIYAVFLLSKGLTYTQVLLLESVLMLTPLLLEIPTGYIADIFGRKLSLLLSSLSFVVGIGMFLFAESFPAFAVAMILVGFGNAFRSGADSAFVYDTLLTEKKEKKFQKIWGNAQLILFVTAAIAALAGGWLADIDFLIPIGLTVAALIISLLIVFFFKEPVREKPILGKGHMHFFGKILKFSVLNSQIRALLIYAALFSPLILVYQVLVQPLTVNFGLSLSMLGIFYSFLLVFAGLGSFLASKFHNLLPVKRKLFFVSFVGGAAVIAVALIKSPWALLLLIFPAFAHGMSRVLINTLINNVTSSDKRATVLSVQSMAVGIGYSLIAIFSGKLIDAYSFKPVLIIAGLLPIIGATLVLILLRNRSSKNGRSTPNREDAGTGI